MQSASRDLCPFVVNRKAEVSVPVELHDEMVDMRQRNQGRGAFEDAGRRNAGRHLQGAKVIDRNVHFETLGDLGARRTQIEHLRNNLPRRLQRFGHVRAMSRCTKGRRDGRSVWVMTGGTCGRGRYTRTMESSRILSRPPLENALPARLDLSVAGVFRLGVSKFTIRHAKRCETFESYIFIKHNTKQFQTFKFTHPDNDHSSDLAAVGISRPPSLFEGMEFEALGKSDEPAVHRYQRRSIAHDFPQGRM